MLAHWFVPLLGSPSAAPVPGAAAVWGYVLDNGMTAGATLVATHAMLRDLFRIHGLEAGMPLAVGPNSRTAGPITQSIADVAGVVTVERAP